MALSFAELRKNRENSLTKVSQELAKLNTNQNSDDERFWSPTVGKDGNGYAVIRFLDSPKGEDVPFIRRWDHGFKGVGGWYIEMSLSTIGLDDPVNEMNSKLWAQGEGSEGRKRVSGSGKENPGTKRRLHYISNILVVNDPGNPDNNGKIFLYKYGQKIFDKLNDAMNPKFPDEKPFNPFDFWTGANFMIKIRNVEGYRNYDKSEFGPSSPLSESDDQIEDIWSKEYSLQAFLEVKNFKSYDELKRKLNKVVGETAQPTASQPAAQAPAQRVVEPQALPTAETSTSEGVDESAGTEDEGLDFFRKLAGSK